jgi:hypothetical protein
VPLLIATVTTVLLSVVTVFPKASRITTTGWVARVAPLAPPTGCVVIANWLAAPAPTLMTSVSVVNPVTLALTVYAAAVVAVK